jgi:hypothetical protein
MILNPRPRLRIPIVLYVVKWREEILHDLLLALVIFHLLGPLVIDDLAEMVPDDAEGAQILRDVIICNM